MKFDDDFEYESFEEYLLNLKYDIEIGGSDGVVIKDTSSFDVGEPIFRSYDFYFIK